MKKFLLLLIAMFSLGLFAQNAGDIIITEMMIDYDSNSTGTGSAEVVGEWFEVYNTTNADIDMNGWLINDRQRSGSNHVIRNIDGIGNPLAVIVPANSYAVMVRDGNSANNGGITNAIYVYGFVSTGATPPVIDRTNTSSVDIPYFQDENFYISGSTNDDGIKLLAPNGSGGFKDIDQVEYCYGYCPDTPLENGFPEMGAAAGASYQLNANFLNDSDNDLASNWFRSTDSYGNAGKFGTPGAANRTPAGVVAVGDIIITEIMMDPRSSEEFHEYFEVYNTTDDVIEMQGWTIGDVSSSSSRSHVISSVVSVPGKSYALFAPSTDSNVNGNLPTVIYGYRPITNTDDSGYPRFNNESTFINDINAFNANNSNGNPDPKDGVFLTTPTGVEVDRVEYDYGYGTNPVGFPAQGVDSNGFAYELGFSTFNNIDNNFGTSWSPAISIFDANNDFGTPGAANDFNRVYTYDGSWQAPFGDINGNVNPTQDLVVKSGSVVITGQTPVRNTTVDSGSTIMFNGNSGLVINGSTVVNGTITGIPGSGVGFQGTTAQTLSGNGIVAVSAFGLNNAAGLTTSVNVEVTGGLGIQTGSLTNAGSFTFKDSANGASQITPVPSSSQLIGDFKVEKYLSAATSTNSSGRAFRFIASPVNTTGTIFDNWQAGGLNVAGKGTHITGIAGTAGNIDASTGFDETTTGASSLFSFSNNTTQDWTAATSTNQTGDNLTTGKGYRLFVRGDRDPSRLSSSISANATTLTVAGTIATGAQQFTYDVDGDDFVLFGNPYQSQVSMSSVLANSVNFEPGIIYYWDPNIGGSDGRGGYVLVRGFEAGGSGEEVVQPSNPFGASASTTSSSTMRAGESAFLIATAGANGPGASAVLNFAESDKTFAPPAPAGLIPSGKKLNSTVDRIMINLYDTPSLEAGSTPSDAVSLDYKLGVDASQLTNIPKLYNQDESMAISGASGELAVKSLAIIEDGEIVPLALYNYGDSNYTMSIDLTAFEGFQISIFDAVLSKSTLLTNGSINRFDYVVGSDGLSDANRFSIRFTKSALSNEDKELMGLSMYPNPVIGGNLFVNGLRQEMNIEVFNSLGQSVKSVSAKQLSNSALSTTGWSASIYFVKVTEDDKSMTFKIVKQ